MTPEWLEDAYSCGPDERIKRGELAPMLDWIFQQSDFVQLDTVMRKIDLTRIAPVFMVGLLRFPSSQKDNLPEWSKLVIRVRDELLRRGETREQVIRELIGLVGADGELLPPDLPPEPEPPVDLENSPYADMAGKSWWMMLLSAPDRTLDASMFPLIEKWSDPPLSIEILEVLDKCIYGALCSNWIVILLQGQYDDACNREGIAHEDNIPFATWRSEHV